jgi:hypothetical protein
MRWLEATFVINLWPTLVIWSVLYVLDYIQTLRGARLYHQVGKQYVATEGSYELTPYFQADVDKFRMISYRLLLMLAISLAGVTLVWWLASLVGLLEIFSVLAGGLILRSVVVHTQHIRNIASFRYVAQHPDQIKGKIEYARALILWNRSIEFGLFAGLFLALFAITGSWFVAGGALGCLAIAGRMLLWRRKALANPNQSKPASTTTSRAPSKIDG